MDTRYDTENKMAIVRKAVAQDFEKTYPLFVKLNNPHLSKDDWRQLFIDHWHTNKGYFGYVLEDGEHVVGFLGLIFGHRTLNAQKEKFCNITTKLGCWARNIFCCKCYGNWTFQNNQKRT